LSALKYLHYTKGLFHRDLKPENVLMYSTDIEDIQIKVADFGFATKILPNINLGCGSSLYMAPEIYAGKVYNEKVDVWSVGVITFVVLSGSPPFYEKGVDVEIV
jgi:serine/threonine protein kinase